MTISKVIVICAASCLSDKLQNENTICERPDIVRWKVDNVKVEIVTFVLQICVKSVVVVMDVCRPELRTTSCLTHLNYFI